MKKLFLALLSMMMVLTLAGCSSKKEETVEVVEETEETTDVTVVSAYNITNNTGSKVTTLTFTVNATGEVSENLVGEEGLEDGATLTVNADTAAMFADFTGAEADAHGVFTLAAECEDGTTITFATLSREEANISLLAVDARTGATEIAFTF